MPHILWLDTDHRLLAASLHRLLEPHGFILQTSPEGAHLCLRDFHTTLSRTLDTPTLPTIALVHPLTHPAELRDLLRLGYRGYVSSQADPETLVHALRRVRDGHTWAEPAFLLQLVEHDQDPHLTSREREVLFYLRKGWSNAEIARQLGIAYKTVKVHVSAVLAKRGVRHRIELVVPRA
ncbi:response regulator transcription factor [Deinococcus pimensis]|uniref:response regulator transcription factor n=1 Tax=Deinococcus pimensis TaxID=309888 RepID=UPI0004B6A4AA|nr:response regulator transcription factor [Deinococcus pimensis]